MPRPHQKILKSSRDLETTYEAIRSGFVSLALEKNRRATPFVAEARVLKATAAKAKSPAGLLAINEIQSGLLTASGVSDKAAGHLQDSDKREAIEGLITRFLDPAGANFVEELVFRFLLTRGDTLGGSMRNVGGFMAQKKLTRCIVAALKLAGKKGQWLHGETNRWESLPMEDADIELTLRGLTWRSNEGPRTLLYNMKVPFLGNNVDLVLFNESAVTAKSTVIRSREAYLALGELKGGIDPAGADEHWKTARSALNRIHETFARRRPKPHTFFVGAAIERKMALEIWKMLEGGIIENAANLTNEDQIAAIASWLCGI